MILGINGCGGGNSSASTTPATPTTNKSVGTGYYVDSAVSGINYKCGSQEGITDANGAFTFEKGKSCAFYLGDIKFRDVASADLVDGAHVVETDVKVAQLLQTLDTDGNPANGITITPEAVKELSTAVTADGRDGSLPDTMEELEALSAALEDVDGYAGHAVSADDAKTHLATTQTKELLAGKTFYVVGNDEEGWEEFEVHFNNDVTIFTDDEGNEDITITGNRLIFNDDTDGSYTIVTPMAEYILFDDRNADGSKNGSGHYAFSSEEKAQEFLESKSGGGADGKNENYTVYGGNIYFSGGFSAMPTSYVVLGESKATSTFNGTYKYYVIANQNEDSTIYVDAVKGSDNEYYSTSTTSNTGDTWQNLAGAPDNKYVSIGDGGYILIDAQNTTLNKIEIFLK